MIVVISRFQVANDMSEKVKEAFRNRPHLVDGVPGFIRLDVLSPLEQPDEIWLITHWLDEASYQAWHRSHRYQDSHRGIPTGLKLVPGATEIKRFHHVCS